MVRLEQGDGADRNEAQAAYLFGGLCDEGHTASCTALGRMLADGRGEARNDVRAMGSRFP
ncbi:MAG: hypothetical protein R3F14_19240 [Polyangiaceae bacterium]